MLNAFDFIFETDAGIKTVDTVQARQLSPLVKTVGNISKNEQDAIYKKFIEIEPREIYPRTPLTSIFYTLKQLLAKLSQGRIGFDEVMGYLGQYA